MIDIDVSENLIGMYEVEKAEFDAIKDSTSWNAAFT